MNSEEEIAKLQFKLAQMRKELRKAHNYAIQQQERAQAEEEFQMAMRGYRGQD